MEHRSNAAPEPLVASLQRRAVLLEKGNHFEDFTVGQEWKHRWGRTLTQADNVLFNSLTLNYNPLYLNGDHAREQGHPGELINPYLVFLIVFGLSVEDLSEKGGAFLGVERLIFHRHVVEGDTVSARSTVTALRSSGSRPDHGIATWHTRGTASNGEVLLEFTRTNLIPRRPSSAVTVEEVGAS